MGDGSRRSGGDISVCLDELFQGLDADKVSALVQTAHGPFSQRSGEDHQTFAGERVGTFDLPPIPLARLPPTKEGLPQQWSQTTSTIKISSSCVKYPKTYGGKPLCDYDASNCQSHQVAQGNLPPLPPSFCFLPPRTRREAKTQRTYRQLYEARSRSQVSLQIC